ncbi:hypothetical protein WR25_14087 [Diploscapter pachys]|uniref:Uncharacterized protein n=1 Tax=Diploscapter pachys TaxID=2018661 RepID=A0A2A2KT51_9BILA|nr:hypothetical protein WR25_14087 [Diploscapter pachys]
MQYFRMSDYALVRSHSVVIPRSSSYLSRTRSVPNLTGYYHYSSRYSPQWSSSVWQTTPYKWRADWDWYDDYWYNRHYFSSYTPYYTSRRYNYRMSDYALVRASSYAIPRAEALFTTPAPLMTHSRSVSDMGSYFRHSEKYRPQWHHVWQSTPYKWREDWNSYDGYWYSTYNPRGRYTYNDYLQSTYTYGTPRNYWMSSYYPSTYKYPHYKYCLNSYGEPYRSYLRDSSLNPTDRGLGMHRAGRCLWHY